MVLLIIIMEKKLYHIKKKKIEDLFLNSFITQFVDYYLYNYKS